MPAPRKYDVLVDGECVYTGLLRTAEIVYSACIRTVSLSTPSGAALVPVTLALRFEHPSVFSE